MIDENTNKINVAENITGVSLGTIFSYQNTPSLSKIYFQINKDAEVNKGQFVCVQHPLGKVVCMVLDIFRYNPYFENITFESNVKDVLPVGDWHTSIAETKPLGILAEKGFVRMSFPPYPGANVIMPKSEELFNFLGFVKSGLHLGDISNPTTSVNLDVSKLFQKHLAILAMSGAGKSYSVSVLLEELLMQPKDQIPAIILFDVHGEYTSLSEPVSDNKYKDFSKHVTRYDATELKFALHSLDNYLFSSVFSDLSDTAYAELMPILNKLRLGMQQNGTFNFDDLRKEIEENVQKDNVKKPLLRTINYIEGLNLFANKSTFSFDSIIQAGHLSIIDMSKVLDMSHKQIILAYFANNLFRLRQNNKLPPFIIVLEEAHQFVPESKSEYEAKARPIIETIAREGRKFGASLCLISQRPIKLSTTVLSQCNTHMIMRITNPYDLKHISESSESLDSKSTEVITGLNVGECLLVGAATSYPLFFKVRQRISQPNKYEKNLQDLVKDFVHKKKKDLDELDTYM